MLALYDSYGTAGSFFVLYDPQASLEAYLSKIQAKKQLFAADAAVIAAQVRFGNSASCVGAMDIRTVARNPKYIGVVTPLLQTASIKLDAYFTGDRDHSNNGPARNLFAKLAKNSAFEKKKMANYAISDGKTKEKIFLAFNDEGTEAVKIAQPVDLEPCYIGSEPNAEFNAQKRAKLFKFQTFGTAHAFKATKSGYDYEELKRNHQNFIKNVLTAQKVGNSQELIEDALLVAAERLFDQSYGQ